MQPRYDYSISYNIKPHLQKILQDDWDILLSDINRDTKRDLRSHSFTFVEVCCEVLVTKCLPLETAEAESSHGIETLTYWMKELTHKQHAGSALEQLSRRYPEATRYKMRKQMLDHVKLDAIIKELERAIDLLILANKVFHDYCKKYPEHIITNMGEFIEVFHNNGGLELVEALYNGTPIEDLVPYTVLHSTKTDI